MSSGSVAGDVEFKRDCPEVAGKAYLMWALFWEAILKGLCNPKKRSTAVVSFVTQHDLVRRIV